MVDREIIYSTVYEIFAGAADFHTKGRRVKHWADVDADRQPALFMAQGAEVVVRDRKGIPAKSVLGAKLYIYCRTRTDDDPIGPVMNPLLDAVTRLVDTKALPDGTRRPLFPNETNDLGIPGVSHCWIEGTIETDEGALGSQGVAIIPISILTT